jgi:hypothetical protein
MITKRKIRQRSSGKIGVVTEIPSQPNCVIVAVMDPTGQSAISGLDNWSIYDENYDLDLELLPDGA